MLVWRWDFERATTHGRFFENARTQFRKISSKSVKNIEIFGYRFDALGSRRYFEISDPGPGPNRTHFGPKSAPKWPILAKIGSDRSDRFGPMFRIRHPQIREIRDVAVTRTTRQTCGFSRAIPQWPLAATTDRGDRFSRPGAGIVSRWVAWRRVHVVRLGQI